jgi:NAD(P)-dependent dehydrogenase (short-subunit alcohol dehydrogenase family)
MRMRLTGKVAMVTGGGSGIGRAIALAMAQEGADIVIPDIQVAKAEQVAAEIQALGRKATAQKVDVSKEGDVQAAIAEGIRQRGGLDILVNNAGIAPNVGLPFTRQVEEDWDRVFDINVKSVFFSCKHITPHFMERRAGKVVNIASIAGPMSSTTMPSYSVAKMSVITFTKTVAKELARYNVNVNAICPGLLYTEMWQKIGARMRETDPSYAGLTPRQIFERKVKEWIPLQREQTPEDIANAAVFLVSEEARNITGQVLIVDGGILS